MTFASDRLAYQRLRRDEVPALCARITPACLAEISVDGDDLRKPDTFWVSFSPGYTIRLDRQTVGAIGFSPFGFFGIWIAPEHRGRGYGSETVRAFMTHSAFDRIIQRVGCYEDNVACRKIIAANSFIEKRRSTIKSPFCARRVSPSGMFALAAPRSQRRSPRTRRCNLANPSAPFGDFCRAPRMTPLLPEA